MVGSTQGDTKKGLKIELWSLDGGPSLLKTVTSNQDGRVDAPLLDGEELKTGQYELRFHAGAYLKATGSMGSVAVLKLPPRLCAVG